MRLHELEQTKRACKSSQEPHQQGGLVTIEKETAQIELHYLNSTQSTAAACEISNPIRAIRPRIALHGPLEVHVPRKIPL